MPCWQTRILPDTRPQLLFRAPLFHALRCLVWFLAQALLVRALLHVLRHAVEAFARASAGFPDPPPFAVSRRDAAAVPRMHNTPGTLPGNDEGVYRRRLICWLAFSTGKSNTNSPCIPSRILR